MADAGPRRVARPRIRRRLRVIGLGLVLLPALALAAGVRALVEADREAGRRDARERRARVRSAAEDLAARLGARPDLFTAEAPGSFDLREVVDAVELARPVVIDGDCDDWRAGGSTTSVCTAARLRFDRPEMVSGDGREFDPADLSFGVALGRRAAAEGDLYVHLQVRDDDVRVRRGGLGEADELHWMTTLPWGRDGAIDVRFVTAFERGGATTTYQVGADWHVALSAEARHGWGDYRAPTYRRPYGVWRRVRAGYEVEMRLPLRRLGERWREARVGLAVVDVDAADDGLRRQAIWITPAIEGHLAMAAPRAAEFGRAWDALGIDLRARRVALLDDRGRELLARFGRTEPDARSAPRDRVSELLGALRRAEADSVLHADVPLAVAAIRDPRGRRLGFVVEADAAEVPRPQALAVLRERPVLAGLLGGALVLLFALLRDTQRLSRRILALVDDVGADRDADDEIGELSRRLHDLVERVRADRSYLERLPALLGHETLGPLGVVRMYLDDVEARAPDCDVRRHAARRALRAVEELIEDLREATSLEDALARGEPCDVDLAAFLEAYLLAYAESKGARIQADLVPGPIPVRVLEGRLEQLLDKLLDNAVEFSDGEPVHVRLRSVGRGARIRVENVGPPLPDGPAAEQLFEPMWSARKRTRARHLGMGLYVARLIAEHHGAALRGWNAGDGRVVFELALPASGPSRAERVVGPGALDIRRAV